MGLFDTEPNVQQFDPTPQAVRPLGQTNADFLQGLMMNPTGAFGATTSQVANPTFEAFQGAFSGIPGLEGAGTALAQEAGLSPTQQQTTFTGNPFSQFLSQNPEMQTFNQLSGGLTDLANQGIGGVGAGQQVINAAQPVFDRNLQTANTQLANTAPSVLNSAFQQQGQDLAGRALQDFSLFQQQALQQGQQTDLQARLGASQALGGLAGAAGQAQTERFINPTLQLMLGGLGFAQPQPIETVVGQSPLSQFLGGIGDLGATAAAAATGFGG